MSTLKERSQAILDEKKAKILPENIKKDVQIFDIVGTMEEGIDTSDATAEPNDIVNGKIAYVNGERVTGTIEEITDLIGQPADHIQITGNEPSSQINIRYNFPSDVLYRQDAGLLLLTNNETLANAAEITPEKIVEGNTILGIAGTAEIGGSGEIKLFETVEELQADGTAQEGDLAIVYNTLQSSYARNDAISILYLPEIITLETPYTDTSTTYFELGSQCSIKADRILYQISIMEDDVFCHFSLTYSSTDGKTYTREADYREPHGCTYENDYLELPRALTLSYDGMGTDNTNRAIIYGPQIFMNKNKDFSGLYKYTKGTWSIAPTQLDAQINDVLTGKKMYSKTGVIEGDGSIFDNMNLSDLVAYKTNTNNYEKGLYVKGNIAEIESPGVVVKENQETLNLLTKSIYMLKPQEIPEQYASLFVEDASFDNSGVHTIYLDGMIVKDKETGYAQHTVTIFSPDYKTVILDTTTINYNLQTYTRSSDPDVLNWFGYGCGGTLNIKTGEIIQLASTPSAGYYYGRSCIVDGTTLYFANQTGLYKNGTKIATLSMVDSSGSWGYICQHLNGYIYVLPISGSQRQYAKIKLSDNSVTYYDDTLELTGYIQYLDGDVTDKLYFTADSKIYSLDENGWELLDIPEIPSGFFTTPVKYGYIPTVRVRIINDTLTFISLVKGKMIYGTEIRDLYAYDASALNFWSSASISPILLDDTIIYAYELSNGVFRQFRTEPTLTEGTDEIYRLVSTGVANENIVISNTMSF